MKISGGNIHSAGMHMRQMQILLSGGKSAADMALFFVDIKHLARFIGFADAKLLCSLTHRGIVFNYVVGDFHRPCLNI